MAELRQRLMILYQYTSDLASRVGAWSIYDGAGAKEHGSGDAEQPPYASALAAMRDGWRVIQMPQPFPALPRRRWRSSWTIPWSTRPRFSRAAHARGPRNHPEHGRL